MKKWDVVAASFRTHYVEEYLRDGYEPFSVTLEKNGDHLVWMRKLVEVIK